MGSRNAWGVARRPFNSPLSKVQGRYSPRCRFGIIRRAAVAALLLLPYPHPLPPFLIRFSRIRIVGPADRSPLDGRTFA